MRILKRTSAASLLFLIALFEVTAFSLLAFKTVPTDLGAFYTGGISVLLLIAQYLALTAIFRNIDRFLIIITSLLTSIGLIVQYRLDPDVAVKQLVMIVAGTMAMIAAIVLLRNLAAYKKPVYVYMLGSIGLLTLSLLFGREIGGAKNWFSIAGIAFQPSEFVKVALVFVLAAVLCVKQRSVQLLPLAAYVAVCMGLLVLQRDLGAALLYGGTALIVYYTASGNLVVTGAALGAASAGAYASYLMFDHVRVRVQIWRNPWSTYTTQGYQVAQGLMAIGSGGLLGMGLTLGAPKSIPAYQTDYIFAVICEEMGIVIGICIIAFYLVLILRGLHIALNANDRFSSLLAIGVTTMITLQSFIIIGGVIKLIPLTGITLPFVSYGGSSMITCMILMGVLQAIAIQNGEQMEEGGFENA